MIQNMIKQIWVSYLNMSFVFKTMNIKYGKGRKKYVNCFCNVDLII